MPCGPRRRRTIAVRPWAGAARRQLCQKPHRQFRRPHSQHSHPHRRPRHRPRSRPRGRRSCRDQQRRQPQQPQLDLLIHTIAPWGSTSGGIKPNSSGAAGSTTSVGSRRNHQPQQIPTIARMGSRTGRLVGLFPRRNGVVGCMAKAARPRVVAACRMCHRVSRTIATLDLPIGWRVGPWPRRHGVVRTRARVARRQLEDVLEIA